MIITRFGRDLPDYLSGLCTPLRVPCVLRRETRGPQTSIRECPARLVPEAHQTGRKRSTRRGVWGFLSLSRIAAGGQRVGPAVEVL